MDPCNRIYKVKAGIMENEELERSVIIVGMVLVLITFIMGILDSL